jgi:VanZ family protein
MPGVGVVLLVIALAVQVWSVYAPNSPAQPTFADEDKIAHALLFGVPVAIAWASRLRPRVLTAIIAAHAPVSELVQHYVLPHRSGDVWDAVADLVGVLIGVLAGRALARVVSRTSTRW